MKLTVASEYNRNQEHQLQKAMAMVAQLRVLLEQRENNWERAEMRKHLDQLERLVVVAFALPYGERAP